MPRTTRASIGGMCYHVIDWGNPGLEVYRCNEDYQGFITLMGKAKERMPMRILTYCIMSNHFHLVLWPFEDGDLGCWMQWLLTSHVRRHHKRNGTYGRVWQGRFKAFPIQDDEHLLTVCRYVERNPVRAGLVEHAEDWQWSGLPCGSSEWAQETASRLGLEFTMRPRGRPRKETKK